MTQVRRSPLSREHSRVSKSTDFIISVKRSRHNAKNFDPWIRLTKPVNLNNQAIGIFRMQKTPRVLISLLNPNLPHLLLFRMQKTPPVLIFLLNPNLPHLLWFRMQKTPRVLISLLNPNLPHLLWIRMKNFFYIMMHSLRWMSKRKKSP